MIQGLFTAVITPFTEEGALNLEGFRQNIRFQIESHVDGIAILGSTGEASTLTEEEREKLITAAIEETRGKCGLMVGTGSNSTADTIEKTRKARKAGADTALIVTPYYIRPTAEGLYQHYKAVAAAVDVPIMIYNNASRTCVNLLPETLQKLASIPNIIGIKESSGNIAQIAEMIARVNLVRDDFSFMSGDDIVTLPLMALGGHGVISVVSNLVPHIVRTLVDTALEGNFHLTRTHLNTLMPLICLAFIETNPIPIKTLMHLAGMPAGPCRLPLCEISADNKKKLQEVLQKFDIHIATV